MALNKSTGNMYAFVSHTYNPLNSPASLASGAEGIESESG